MPRPPSQITNAFHGVPPLPKYASGEEITWYSRAPTMPNGTAQTATSRTRYGGAPRRRIRISVTAQATTMPATMHRA